MLGTSAIGTLSTLIAVIFNSWFHNSNIPALLCYVSSSKYLLPFVFWYDIPHKFFLAVGHEVFDKRNGYKQAFSRVTVSYWGEEVFHNAMIRSQSFSEPMPLDGEFHKCFSGFFSSPTLGGQDG